MRTCLAALVAAFAIAGPHAAQAATASGTLSVTAVVVDSCAYQDARGGARVRCTAPVPFSLHQRARPIGSAVPGTTVFF